MRELIAARAWLTVFRFPTYAPELNPVPHARAAIAARMANGRTS